jgi:hypothetical protein
MKRFLLTASLLTAFLIPAAAFATPAKAPTVYQLHERIGTLKSRNVTLRAEVSKQVGYVAFYRGIVREDGSKIREICAQAVEPKPDGCISRSNP